MSRFQKKLGEKKDLLDDEMLRDVASREMGNPSLCFRKEADSGEERHRSHIKPMGIIWRYADQIALLAKDFEDLVSNVQEKES